MPKSARPLILDASVAAKWFINEPDSEKAAPLLRQIAQGKWQLAAPEIVSYELAHVFWKRRPLGYSRRQLDLALRELEVLNLQSVPLTSLFPRALDTAYRFEIAIYDAFYVALAQALKGVLATFDAALVKQVKKHTSLQIYAFES